MPLNHCHHSDVIMEDYHSRLASVSALKLKYAIALVDLEVFLPTADGEWSFSGYQDSRI